MKKRFKILTFLFFASLISLFIGYTQASTVNQVKEQIIQTADLVGDKYVEATEKLNIPKPAVPIIPILMPLSVFVAASVYAMNHSASKKKPTRFYVVGTCGDKVEVTLFQTYWKDNFTYSLKAMCNFAFDILPIAGNSKNEVIHGVKEFCEECEKVNS